MNRLTIWASRPGPLPFADRLAGHELVVGSFDDIPTDFDAIVAAARPDFGDDFMRAHRIPSFRLDPGDDELAAELCDLVASTTRSLGL